MERYLFKTTIAIKEASGKQKERREKNSEEFFTGKLVKSLLIDGNPRLKKLFEKTSGSAPKLIHVTPFYIIKNVNGKDHINCIHTLGDVGSSDSTMFSFYVGLIESSDMNGTSMDEVYNALLNVSGYHRFRARTFDVELSSIETVDVAEEVRKVIFSLNTLEKIKVIFSSPTLLRDPFRTGKHKSLIPTPANIFSTPVYINLYLMGKLKWKLLIRTLMTFHRLLGEPYSVYKTIRIIRVKYDENKNPIPALAGYINLYLNKYYRDL
ncbi:MAG: hypothetical protein QXO75_08745, partial [Nitrososphaerota archaeon]